MLNIANGYTYTLSFKMLTWSKSFQEEPCNYKAEYAVPKKKTILEA